ncbi:MAG: oligosaccharide flippase family protein [Methylacidiphilales bacterium]|nr:oligosaccharide flippase family protein [Candidatus Methylacidiphilales bacterium]
MSRFRRTLHGVVSGYILLVSIGVYSLASVPLALHYLDTQRFGLWILMGTLAGYLNLIDAGVTIASFRLIVDHKDDRDGGNYGSLIQTGWLVSTTQGGIIFAIGLLLAGTFARLLAIPVALQPEFIHLVYWQCGAAGLSFSTRILGLILGAFQRMDLSNYIGVASLAVNFVSQWIFFHFGFGVISLAFGAILATVLSIVAETAACLALKLFPRPGAWGRASWVHFRELFGYGKDLFLVNIGTQLITASQTIIITRMLGLEKAATWGVGLRVYNLLNQIVWRIYDTSGSAFAEMIARREFFWMRDRYRSLAMLTFSMAGWAAVSFAMCNSLFISIWTHGKIQWSVEYDCLLAVLMIVTAAVHCHSNFVLLTKQVYFMRYIHFLEGLAFVAMSLLVVRSGGLAAMIACSIVCAALFSCAYSIWRISRFCELPIREVAFGWFQPMGKMLCFYLPVAGLTWWLTWWLFGPLDGLARLAIHAVLAASVGGYLFLRFGIPASFQNELLGRVPARAVPFLKRVFVQAA